MSLLKSNDLSNIGVRTLYVECECHALSDIIKISLYKEDENIKATAYIESQPRTAGLIQRIKDAYNLIFKTEKFSYSETVVDYDTLKELASELNSFIAEVDSRDSSNP